MEAVSNNSVEEKNIYHYIENFWLWIRMRISGGFISNLFDAKSPLFCRHKLTYNCNLRSTRVLIIKF